MIGLILNKEEENIILEALEDSRYLNISNIRKLLISHEEDLIPCCENKINKIEQLKINMLKQIDKED